MKWVRTNAYCGATKFDEMQYLTIGKWYKVEADYGDAFKIIDDVNEIRFCRFTKSAHLDDNDWQVFEGVNPPS